MTISHVSHRIELTLLERSMTTVKDANKEWSDTVKHGRSLCKITENGISIWRQALLQLSREDIKAWGEELFKIFVQLKASDNWQERFELLVTEMKKASENVTNMEQIAFQVDPSGTSEFYREARDIERKVQRAADVADEFLLLGREDIELVLDAEKSCVMNYQIM